MPANEYDALVATLPPVGVTPAEDPAPVANPYDDLVQQLGSSKDAALQASARVGLQQTPDRAAQVMALASATRLPADMVDRNLDEVQRQAKVREIDLERTQREHPELAGWLANPRNMAVAQDDMPVLRHLDRAVAGLVAGPGDDPFGILPKGFKFGPGGTINELHSDGNATVYNSLADLDHELAKRRLNIGLDQAAVETDAAKLQDRFGPASNLVAGAASSLASTQAAIGTQTSDGRNAANDLAAASQQLSPGLSGSIQRGVGGLAADLPLMLAGGPLAEGASALMKASRARAVVATLLGTRTAKAAGTFAATVASVQPLAIREGLADAQQNGAGSGAANYLIESLIPGAFGRTGIQRALVPGVDHLATGADGWLPAAKHLLLDAGMEATEEATTELGHALFEVGSGQNPNALKADQLLPRLAAAGAVGGLAGAVFNLPQVARDKWQREAVQLRQSTLEADGLAAAFDLARSSKTGTRNPEQLQHLLERHTGTAGTTTYFQSEDFVAHYEAKGADPELMAVQMGVDQATYQAARAAGSAIPVPTAGFLAHTTEDDRPLLDKARMRPDGLNREELGTATEEMRTLLQGAISQAKQSAEQSAAPVDTVTETGRAKIRSEVEAQLIAAGRDATTARNESLLVSEPMANLAERFNTQSREQADREALATFKREHSGNLPDQKSDEWKTTLEKARAAAPVVDPFEIYSRYIKRIGRGEDPAAVGRSLEEQPLPVHNLTLKEAIGETIGENVTLGRPTSSTDQQGNPVFTTYQKRVGGAWVKSAMDDGITPAQLDEAFNRHAAGKDISSIKAGRWILKNQEMIIAEAVAQRHLADTFKVLKSEPVATTEEEQRIADELNANFFQSGIVAAPGHSLEYVSLVKQWKKANGDRTPSPKSEEWDSLVQQAAKIDAANGRSYDQPARGKINVAPGRELSVGLLEGADRSTFVHEMGHAYLEILDDLATNGAAPDSIVADVATIRTWLGADEKSAFTVDQHEQFARGFERYLMEGKAPSSTLRRAFANFKNWLTKIYRDVLALNVNLTPEVRSVFDRLLASDDAIARSSEEIGNKSPWETAAEAGMSEEQFASYLKEIDYRKDRAADFVRARLMHADFLAESEERDREREVLKADLSKQIDAQPVYQAIRLLQDGQPPEGLTLDEMLGDSAPEEGRIKLNKDDLLRTYTPADLAKLPGPQAKDAPPRANRGKLIYSPDGGMTLADAALMFGYQDGDALWMALTTAPDRDATVSQQVDAEMAKRYPDPLVDGSLDVIAKGELADQVAGHVLDREVKALGSKVGQQVAPTEILRQVARDLINKTKASNLRPDTYWRAARTASAEAFSAAAKARDGKPEQQAKYDRQAFDAAQRERFSLHLFRAATEAKEASDKGRTYLNRFDTLDTRQRLGKAGGWEFTVYDEIGNAAQVVPSIDDARKVVASNPGFSFARTNGYLEQIDNILEGYDLRRVSNRELRRRESLQSWIARQEDAGEPVNIGEQVIADLGRRNWSDLTVAEQAEVLDAVRNVEHLAKLKNKLLKDRAKRELEEASALLVSGINEHATRTVVKRIGTTWTENAQDRFVRYFEDHRKDSFLAREMDGYQNAGPVWEYLIRPRNEASAAEQELLSSATLLRDSDFKEWQKSAGISRQDIPGTRLRLNNEQRLGLVLNWGNAEGRQRVLMYLGQLGYGKADMQAVIDSLDEADWKLVNATWKQIDSYWSEIRAIEQRTTGLPPEKVEALPIDSRFGRQAGGYYPIKYDQRLSSKAGDLNAAADAKQALRAAMGSNQTRRGHTKQRARDVSGLALRLDFGVVGEHLSEVIHDITHRELLIDQNKLLRDAALSQAIIDRYGRGALDQFVNTAADIAVGDKPARSASERLLRGLRKNSSAATFGFNLTSALVNLTGLAQSIPRVGAGYMGSAFARVFRDATHMEASATWVKAKSSTMRQRASTQLQNLQEATGRVEPEGKLAAVRRWGYYPMHKVQQAVDTVTWIGAYERGMAEGLKAGKPLADAEADAVAIADQTVLDTQGSGRIGDLSAFQRGGEASKVLTAFYSYFNVTYNLQREAVQQVRADPSSPRSWLRAGTDTLLVWTLPAVASGLLTGFLRGEKDKDEKKRLEQMAADQVAYGMGMLVGVREVGGAVQGGFGYSGPAGLRSFDVANGLVLQLRQGDVDKAALKAAIGASGALLGLPAVEINRIIDSIETAEKKGDPAAAIRVMLFGKPR
jgi:hypothetical protein